MHQTRWFPHSRILRTKVGPQSGTLLETRPLNNSAFVNKSLAEPEISNFKIESSFWKT